MYKSRYYFLILLTFFSCYQAPVINDFDPTQWKSSLVNCNDYRINASEEIIEQKEKLLSKNQNEIVALLGNPEKHELFDRNQKFFFYQLDCEKTKELSLRFDALGRVREVQVIKLQIERNG